MGGTLAMKNIGEMMLEIAKEQGVSDAASLANLLGVSSTAVYNWINKGSVPRRSYLEAFCLKFGVTEARLRGFSAGEKKENKHGTVLTLEEMQLIQAFRNCSAEQRNIIMRRTLELSLSNGLGSNN